MNIRERHFFDTYFIMVNLADDMRVGRNYKGPNTIILKPFEEYCTSTTPSCEQVCIDRRISLSRGGLGYGEFPLCRNFASPIEGFKEECWETFDMRCWGIDTEVNDGRIEWTKVNEDLEGISGIPWVHFVNGRTHLFVFGQGSPRPIQEVCRKAQHGERLLNEIESHAQDEFLLMGHSEGSLWASCFNLVLAQKGVPAEKRHIIGTGVPLVHSIFLRQHQQNAEPDDTTNFLLVGIMRKDEILLDVLSIQQSFEWGAVTLPQFAYICGEKDKQFICLDPQPSSWEYSIEDSVQFISENPSDRMISILHDIRTYRTCFNLCRNYFQRTNEDFSPNIPQFVKSQLPPLAEESGPSDFQADPLQKAPSRFVGDRAPGAGSPSDSRATTQLRPATFAAALGSRSGSSQPEYGLFTAGSPGGIIPPVPEGSQLAAMRSPPNVAQSSQSVRSPLTLASSGLRPSISNQPILPPATDSRGLPLQPVQPIGAHPHISPTAGLMPQYRTAARPVPPSSIGQLNANAQPFVPRGVMQPIQPQYAPPVQPRSPRIPRAPPPSPLHTPPNSNPSARAIQAMDSMQPSNPQSD